MLHVPWCQLWHTGYNLQRPYMPISAIKNDDANELHNHLVCLRDFALTARAIMCQQTLKLFDMFIGL